MLNFGHKNDIIYALSTPPGRSAIAVLRLSGKDLSSIIELLSLAPLTPRYAHLRKIIFNGSIIDEALTLLFKAPHSYTGEDMLELHLHGSLAVINEMTRILYTIEGCRPASAGEFTARAFEAQKMDLAEIEGLADLIDSETRLQQRQAMQLMQGIQSNLYNELRDQAASALAHLEATIDFSDEDIPADLWQHVGTEIELLIAKITTLLSDGRSGERLRNGYRLAIVGAPNAGKSTLINLLSKKDVAIVSSVAGTTRDSIEIHLDINGIPVTLIDTAGLHASEDPVEMEGIRRAIAHADNADIKLVLFDAASLPYLPDSTLDLLDNKSIAMISRADLLPEDSEIPLKAQDFILYSSFNSQSAQDLLSTIESKLTEQLPDLEHPVVSHDRHRYLLEDALSHLHRFSSNLPIEIACEEIRSAANALGKITGKIEVDELLGRIFSEFCIGK